MNHLRNYWVAFRRLHRQLGFLMALKAAAHKVVGAIHPTNINVAEHYQFISQPKFGPSGIRAVPTNSLLWFVPDFQIGSGGHLNIFRLIAHLEQLGYQSSIVIVGGSQFPTPARARECIVQHFAAIQGQVLIGTENLPAASFAIATSWTTAYFVRAFQGAPHKAYFIQDFEPSFYPTGTEALLAENTYRFGFFGVTAGAWLSEKLNREYGMQTWPMGFSVDHDIYFPGPQTSDQPPTIFFYARPPTPRRAFELGVLALIEVAKKVADLKVVMAGWNLSGYKFPFDYVDCGVMDVRELPDTYRRCRAALVISCTNLSLLPLELMACGCPVVSNAGPNVQWLLTSDNAILAEPTVEGLATGLMNVIGNQTLHNKLRAEGIRTASKTSWQNEATEVARILEKHQQAVVA